MFFVSWKLSFKGIKNELDASPIEVLDLLIRCLGPEPSKQGANIRACNAANSADAVNTIWNRLEQRFGSPELIESGLKQRIVSFQTITTNENKRLFDLADLVSEIAPIK